jgi:hypothetical protein
VDGKLVLLDGSTARADVAAVERALADESLLWLDLDQAGEDGSPCCATSFSSTRW